MEHDYKAALEAIDSVKFDKTIKLKSASSSFLPVPFDSIEVPLHKMADLNKIHEMLVVFLTNKETIRAALDLADRMQWSDIEITQPEIGQTVLVHGQTYDVCLYRGKGQWFMGDINYRSELITHWMPLPPPPKETT
jgi:hypothetical protein